MIVMLFNFQGQSGPLATRPGYAFIGCAYSGAQVLGDADRPPGAQLQWGVGDIRRVSTR